MREKSTFTLESSALYTYYKPGFFFLISTPWFGSVYLLGESMFFKYDSPYDITHYSQIIFHKTKTHGM